MGNNLKNTQEMGMIAEQNIVDEEFTGEETTNHLLMNEEDIIKSLIESTDNLNDDSKNDTQPIEIIRGGKVVVRFSIHALSEQEYNWCREKYTKYVRNKQLGIKLPEKTDNVKFRSSLIYHATTEEDRKNFWDNRTVWKGMEAKGHQIVTALDVIDGVLKAGEKERVVDEIDKLSGFTSNQFEDVAEITIKN